MKKILEKLKPYLEKMKMGNSYRKEGIWPERDWKIILSVTFIAVILVGGLSVYFYLEIDQGNLFQVESAGMNQELKIDAGLLTKTIGEINSRQDALANIKNNVPKDPSL